MHVALGLLFAFKDMAEGCVTILDAKTSSPVFSEMSPIAQQRRWGAQ